MTEWDKTLRLSGALDVIWEVAVQRIYELVEPHCESPIEAQFGTAVLMALRMASIDLDEPWGALCPRLDEYKGNNKLLLIPQYQWNRYRIDWAILDQRVGERWIFIECDGHDFHERTKEQAQRDREKDRYIQANDIHVLRFTGSEIYREPFKCARQVFQFVMGTKR